MEISIFMGIRIHQKSPDLLSFDRAHAILYSTPRFAGPLDSDNRVLLACKFMVIDEEFLDLTDKFLAEIINVFHVGIAMIFLLNADDAIVAFPVFSLALFTLDDSYYSAFQKT